MPAPDYAAEISALETALSTGELTIEQDGERVTYKSAGELVKALSYFRQKAAGQASAAARYATTLAVFGND